ncbi:DUF5671 domain-containing protein [Arthrobacter halodurans]|uniref:DUF5671 domain-containing protein n=1 Tax=Arthrobacter halodurans TaxID=516699 RepID=A0ABV4UNC9_9MICC
MSIDRTAGAPATSSPQSAVRRLVVFTLLFALVSIAANGLGALLARLLGEKPAFAGEDVSSLAMALAFTLIGGPLAALLWWLVWRRAGVPAERSALGWGLYVAAVYTVSLLMSATSLLMLGAQLARGEAFGWQSMLATGLVWGGVWAWHRWMWRHTRKGPTALATVPVVVGAVIGLVLGAANAIAVLNGVIDAAVREAGGAASVGDPWWTFTLGSLVWAAGGALIWWWHWFPEGGRRLRGGFADVALVVTGILAASFLALGGAGVVLFVLLRLAFDRTESLPVLLEPLAPGLAAGLVGALVWAYHRRAAAERDEATRQAARLVVSGVALAGAASGIGVVVNSLLALSAPPLAGADTRTLLLGGISSLVIGGPVWWLVWRPSAAAEPAGRRVYLVVVFGLSAVVALVTLLVIGFRLFEFLLDDVTGASLVERIRVPLGLLVATGLVAAYHFAVWRRDRTELAAGLPERPHAIGHVFLVADGDPAALRRAVGDATGARVTVWARADAAPAGPGPDPAGLADALSGVAGDRVLVVTGPDGRIDIIPLAP